MKSGWADADADAMVARGAETGTDRDMALRIYTTRLLGRDPEAGAARWRQHLA